MLDEERVGMAGQGRARQGGIADWGSGWVVVGGMWGGMWGSAFSGKMRVWFEGSVVG